MKGGCVLSPMSDEERDWTRRIESDAKRLGEEFSAERAASQSFRTDRTAKWLEHEEAHRRLACAAHAENVADIKRDVRELVAMKKDVEDMKSTFAELRAGWKMMNKGWALIALAVGAAPWIVKLVAVLRHAPSP